MATFVLSVAASYGISQVIEPRAIRHQYAYTYSNNEEWVGTARGNPWKDMPDMEVNIALAQTSHLLIMFSGEVWTDYHGTLYVRSLVITPVAKAPTAAPERTLAYPLGPDYDLYLPEAIVLTEWDKQEWYKPQYLHTRSSNSFIFYLPSVSAGAHIVKIQWRMEHTHPRGVYYRGRAYVKARTLNVIGLPE